jgi:transposase-like protein
VGSLADLKGSSISLKIMSLKNKKQGDIPMNDYNVKLDSNKLIELFSKKEGLGELIESVLNQVLEKQMDEHLGAERHEQTDERTGYRNGCRVRQL